MSTESFSFRTRSYLVIDMLWKDSVDLMGLVRTLDAMVKRWAKEQPSQHVLEIKTSWNFSLEEYISPEPTTANPSPSISPEKP